MLSMLIDFASMLLGSLLVGSIFGVWLLLNPAGVDFVSYVLLQQQAIRRLNKALPALGMMTVLLTLVASLLRRGEGARFNLLVAAVICFLAGGLITRFLNQPINAIVLTWNCDSPPPNWMRIRDRWWRGHLARLVAGLAGLSLLIVSMLIARSPL